MHGLQTPGWRWIDGSSLQVFGEVMAKSVQAEETPVA